MMLLAPAAVIFAAGCGSISVDISYPEGADKGGYTENDVILEGNGYDIPATVCIPEGDGPYPAVVMLHGTGSKRNEIADAYMLMAHTLAKDHGIASIRIDFPGCGDSKADSTLYDYDSAVDDAAAAAKFISGQDRVNGSAIGVIGWSQGGTNALLSCARHPELFRSLVTFAGAHDMLQTGLMSSEDYETAMKNGYFPMRFDFRDSMNISLKWCEDVVNTDVLGEFAKGYDGPVLAIAGTDDTVVDPKQSSEIAAASTNEKSRTYFINGMDHTFNAFAEEDLHSLREAIDTAADFFEDTLK